MAKLSIILIIALSYVSSSFIAEAVTDKWHPGIYLKIEDWQLKNPVQMEKIYKELADTPQLRGVKVVMKWGRYETRTNDISTYNFTRIENILSRLATMDNKHLIVAIAWREFKSEQGVSQILPNDLQNGVLWNDDPAWEHIDYEYAWAYIKGNKDRIYGYNIKLWNPIVMTRLEAFMEALASQIDTHPNFNQITTTESAVGNPIIPFVYGESKDLQFIGQKDILLLMKKYFTQSLVMSQLNFSRKYVASMIPLLLIEGIGLGSPDGNEHPELIRTTPVDVPGVLTYYPKLSNDLILAPEIQGDSYISTYGAGGVEDYPSYEYLYSRVKNDLKANYTVIQRNTPFWLGDADTPSMLEFLQTYPDIINDHTGAGGLNHERPAMVAVPEDPEDPAPEDPPEPESTTPEEPEEPPKPKVPKETTLNPEGSSDTNPQNKDNIKNTTVSTAETENYQALLVQIKELQIILENLQAQLSQKNNNNNCPNTKLTNTLYFSLERSDVTSLQCKLIKHGFLEPGNVIGIFGPKTLSAVQRMQCDKGITCTGNANSTGFGVVGPMTRLVLNGME